jgi:hypothetical protein
LKAWGVVKGADRRRSDTAQGKPAMSPKMLLIATAALAASAAATIPASAAAPTGAPDQAQSRPVPFRAQIMFNLIDTNADGSLDQTEIAVLQKAIFAAVDADKDGKLTQDEFRKIADGARENIRQFRMGPGNFGHGPDGRWPGMHRGPGGDRQGQLDDQQGPGGSMMQQGDNQDGTPPAGMGQPRDFASLDTNGDGVISPDEFAAGAPDMPGVPPVVR